MHDKVQLFISNCAQSKLGRFVFVAYVVYLVSMISYAYGHIPFTSYPYRFYGERELFEFLNWPQLELIRSTRLLVRWPASRFTDALLAIYIALPWWIYGHIFELIAKRIADSSQRELSGERAVFVGTKDVRWLSFGSVLQRLRDHIDVRRSRSLR